MEATVILCKCTKQNTFGIRMESRHNDWYRTWAFKMDEKTAKREGFDKTIIRGSMPIDEKYPGCPYCGTYSFFQCQCGKLNCFTGNNVEEKSWEVTCNWCGKKLSVKTAHSFEVKGGVL